MESDSFENRISREYSGVAASPGIATGQAYIYDNEYIWIDEKNIPNARHSLSFAPPAKL